MRILVLGIDEQGDAKPAHMASCASTIRYKQGTRHAQSATIDVVRSPHRLKLRNYFDDPDPRAEWAGIYGAGHASGVITYQGQEHPVEGPSYGSALYFADKSPVS